MAQSIEWCHALETMRVPTQMVVYPNEGHVFHKPADPRDYTLRDAAMVRPVVCEGNGLGKVDGRKLNRPRCVIEKRASSPESQLIRRDEKLAAHG
jgi:hypothetical protein